MAVRKYVRYAAPYRSKTFNDKDALLVGRNGILHGGDVSQSGTIVTISPVTMVQNGQIIDIDVALSSAFPSTLPVPFYIALSVSSPVENLGEVITPIYVKRPQDINSQVVLIAEYDGVEWRHLPRLQISERINEAALQNTESGAIGVTSGFSIAQDASTYTTASGTLTGSDGLSVIKTASTILSKISAPAVISQAYDRVDSIVFRKPQDSSYRVGTINLVVGPSFVAATGTVTEATTSFGVSAVTKPRNKDMFGVAQVVSAYIEGSTLKFMLFSDSLVPSAPVTVATLVDDYQYSPNFDGSIDFFYIRNTDLLRIRISTSGAILYPEALVYTSTKTLHNPTVICIGKINSYQVHVAVCRETTGTNREIGYVRMGSDGTIITPYVAWIDLLSNLQRLSFAKDDDDSLLYIGYDNVDTQRAYFRTYDASTATPSAAPIIIGSTIELQTEVYNKVTSTLMPTTGASDVRIVRTATKELFVFWYQFKSAGQYSVAIYNSSFKSKFGYKAFILDDVGVSGYSAKMDGMSRAYLISTITAGTTIYKNVFNLNTLERVGTSDTIISSANITSVASHFCPRGDLLHVIGNTTSGVWTKSTAAVAITLRNVYVTPSDIYLGHSRKSDSALTVSDTLIGEDKSVTRLYEFFNSFGAAGNISWNKAGVSKLVTSQITLRFLNRAATYTIAPTAAGGVTIPDGYVIHVTIPDDDVSGALTTTVDKFGSGFIDRYGKRSLPLFWNIGGRLFSNFAPYSFDAAGETVVIGGTISLELISWLGASGSSPDPTNHAYSSATYILQSDSLNTAIGKLDAALNSVVTGGTANIIPLSVGTTAVAVTFGSARAAATYRIVPNWENLVDADPMIQPCITSIKTVNGFTIKWPSPLDTANYSLDYILRDTV